MAPASRVSVRSASAPVHGHEPDRSDACTSARRQPGPEVTASGVRATNSKRGWFVAPLTIAAILAGAIFVLRGPERAFDVALVALFGTALTWILVSVLWPAKPDRTCPRCGEIGLVRLDPRTTRGVVCDSCGHADPCQSGFLLAEDEGGPIEPMVLDARSRSRSHAS